MQTRAVERPLIYIWRCPINCRRKNERNSRPHGMGKSFPGWVKVSPTGQKSARAGRAETGSRQLGAVSEDAQKPEKNPDTANSLRNLKDFSLGSDLGRRFWHRESTVLLISLTGPVCPGTFEGRPKLEKTILARGLALAPGGPGLGI